MATLNAFFPDDDLFENDDAYDDFLDDLTPEL